VAGSISPIDGLDPDRTAHDPPSGARARVAFIGLGVMGLPMASNLIAAGYRLTVASRGQGPIDAAVALGATSSSTPREATLESDVVISMLPDTPDVESVAEGPDGVLAGLAAGAVWIDMSTISPITSRRLASEAAARMASFLDAPVSGGQAAAKAGSLTIMVGGDLSAFEGVRDILTVLGARVTLVGGPGAGQIAKAANQILVGGTIALVAEALSFVSALGVDREPVREALLGGFAQSKVLELHGQRMLDGDFAPGFRADLQHKDLSIALDTGRVERLPLPMTSQVRELFNVLRAQGGGDLDHSALALAYESISGRDSGLGVIRRTSSEAVPRGAAESGKTS
jgi:2-hydroxy-3-oxopropionate reductase